MKFSLIYEAQTVDASRAGDRKVFHDMVEQCLLAEEMGFDVIWAVEHTALTQYAHMSAPETFLAFIAGKTAASTSPSQGAPPSPSITRKDACGSNTRAWCRCRCGRIESAAHPCGAV